MEIKDFTIYLGVEDNETVHNIKSAIAEQIVENTDDIGSWLNLEDSKEFETAFQKWQSIAERKPERCGITYAELDKEKIIECIDDISEEEMLSCIKYKKGNACVSKEIVDDPETIALDVDFTLDIDALTDLAIQCLINKLAEQSDYATGT
jgi:hypothetical protein